MRIALFFFLVASNSIYAQRVQLDSVVTFSLDTLYENMLKDSDIPGLAIGILRGNETIYAKGFGVKNLESKEPVTTESLFHMASVSKPFVATAIMQLVERDLIDLESPLTKYLPYFKMADKRYKSITVKHMLTHTSGIPDVEDYEWDKPQYDEGAAERYAKSLSKEKLNFKPGKKYEYSNSAFDVLGDVIAKVSGVSFEEYVKENILIPSGMMSSSFLRTDVPEELATTPHIQKNGQTVVSEVYPYNRAHAPSSTLHSNVEDMLRWGLINLNKGAFDDFQILSPSSYQMLTSPQRETEEGRYVALSWFGGAMDDVKFLHHSGGDTGYRTHFIFLPEKLLAFVALLNCDYFPAAKATYEAYRILEDANSLSR